MGRFLELREDRFSRTFLAMANPHDHPTALKDLQDSIYRDRVVRAKAMTPEERWQSGFEITNEVFQRMLGGAMWKLQTDDPAIGWQQVRLQLARLRKAHDYNRFSNTKPS